VSKYKLYRWHNTGAVAVEAAFAEMGIAYDEVLVDTSAGEHLRAEFRRINPREQLPALALPDGSIMTEVPAMLVHLADSHPEKKLAPVPGSSARAQHDRWLAFFHANVYEGELRKGYSERYVDDPALAPAVLRAAEAYVQCHHLIFEEALGKGPYLFGEAFTMVDIFVWLVANWSPQDWLATHCPKVKRLVDTVAARPAIAPFQKRDFG